MRNIPTYDGIRSPGASIVQGLMDGYFGTRDRFAASAYQDAQLAQQKAAMDIAKQKALQDELEAGQKMDEQTRLNDYRAAVTAANAPTASSVSMPGQSMPVGNGLLSGQSLEVAPMENRVLTPPNPADVQQKQAALYQQYDPAGYGKMAAENSFKVPKENTNRIDLLKTGKYDPESVDAYLGGAGKLKFAAEPFVYKDRNYEKGDKKYYEESMDGGRTWKPVSDAPRYRPTSGNGGDGKPKGRPMPASTAKILTSAADLADTMTRFATGFQPEYAGHTITGGLSTTTGKLFGDNTGQVNFWQDYQGYVNDVRHEKFGAALTPNEKMEFLKYIITERTDPKIAADNLARQKSIVDVALARSSRGYARQYDPATIEEFTGRPIPSADAGKAAPAPYKKPPASSKQPPLGKVGKYSYTVTGQ